MVTRMNIVPAEIDDFDQVYSLICELEQNELDKQSCFETYSENLKANNIYYILVKNESDTIAFASLHIQKLLHHCAKIGELQEIIIRKDMRSLGVGELLFQYVLKIAQNNGCKLLEVCCNKKRLASHQFYYKMRMVNNHYKFSIPICLELY